MIPLSGASCISIRKIILRYLEDAVGVNLEGDLDLRNAPGRRGDAGQVKVAQQVVVLGHRALAFVNLEIEKLKVFLNSFLVSCYKTDHLKNDKV